MYNATLRVLGPKLLVNLGGRYWMLCQRQRNRALSRREGRLTMLFQRLLWQRIGVICHGGKLCFELCFELGGGGSWRE